MKTHQLNKLISVLMATSAVALAGEATAIEYNFYGSLRVQAEAVNPDNQTVVDSYTGFRDAYSRIGVSANHTFDNGATAYAKLEIPVDVANGSVHTPDDHDEHVRVAKIGIKGDFGDIAYGQMWLPYYNAIAYPVDMFSSYYSGWATYTSFRKENTVAYYTPSFSGFSGGLSYTNEADTDRRIQATLSYTNNGLTIAGGLDDLGGSYDARIWGASLAWQANAQLYLAAKYEVHDSDKTSGYGADGDTVVNLYSSYTMDKLTFKAMIADIDNFGEVIVNVGVDYQYNNDLKLFAEYYSEEENAALTTERDAAYNCDACSGGDVFLVGVRYDFSSN